MHKPATTYNTVIRDRFLRTSLTRDMHRHFAKIVRQFTCLGLCLLIGWTCRTNSGDDQARQTFEPAHSQQRQPGRNKHRHRHSNRRTDRPGRQSANSEERFVPKTVTIPQKVRDVLAYVRANSQPKPGYTGGRTFGNFENRLPRSEPSGQKIHYQEWDVNPRIRGQNRGTERLITGSDSRAYYTADHYNTFTEIK